MDIAKEIKKLGDLRFACIKLGTHWKLQAGKLSADWLDWAIKLGGHTHKTACVVLDGELAMASRGEDVKATTLILWWKTYSLLSGRSEYQDDGVGLSHIKAMTKLVERDASSNEWSVVVPGAQDLYAQVVKKELTLVMVKERVAALVKADAALAKAKARDNVDALAAELLKLSPADRERLAALLLGQGC